MKSSTKLNSLALALALAIPLAAQAESNVSTGAGALTTTARVDFSVVIPKILFLRVGSAGAGIDSIVFTVPSGSVGNATPIAGTGGDLTNGVVTAVVQANSGTVTLNATATGALSDGAGDSINYTQIVTTAATNTTATVLAAPVLANGTSGNVTLTPVSKIVNQDAKWTYTYSNSAVVPAGTYGGVNTNNSRVTYTATMP
ncbi:MAG TPA: hypothetical protein VML56_12270 [Burkholderiales bacterium]|nr:hypothetical protein [Burkholderiales bacterium]HTS54823.1 hypothetical protein [Burkholderiales bacterium]